MKWIWLLLIALALGVVGLATWIAVVPEGVAGAARAVAAPADPAADGAAELDSQAEVGAGSGVEQSERIAAEPAPLDDAVTARSGARLAGRIVDLDLRPIAGATAYAAAADRGRTGPLDSAAWAARERRRHTAQSDVDGRFVLDGLLAGSTRFAARALDYAPYDAEHLVIAPDADLDIGDITLALGARLSGRVVDFAGGAVAGALLVAPFDHADHLYARAKVEALGLVLGESDANGNFDLRSRPVGPWTLLVRSSEFPDLAARGETRVPGEHQSGLLLRLEEGAAIAGAVLVTPGPGAPSFANLSVVARYTGSRASGPGEAQNGSRSGRCEADGSFRIAGCLADEPYQLQARVHRSPDDEQGTWIGEGVDALAGERGVELRIAALTGFAFRPQSARDGAPIDEVGASLFVTRPDGGARALDAPETRLADGRVHLTTSEKLDTGELVNVFVRARGFRSVSSTKVAATPGGENELGVVRLEPLGVARVRIVDADTGAPLENARVGVQLDSGDDGSRPLGDDVGEADERSRHVRSRPSGPDGIATLYASDGARGRACATHDERPASELFDIVFGAPEAEPLEVALQLGGSAEVTVLDPAGTPVAGVVVRARWTVPSEAEAASGLRTLERTRTSDSAGRALLEHLTPGAYTFLLLEDRLGAPRSREERSGSSRVADVLGGEVTAVALTATPHGTLRGRVTEGGRALVGATLELRAGSADEGDRQRQRRQASVLSTATDAQGRYALARVGAGRWTLSVTHPSRVVAYTRALSFEGFDEVFDIEMPCCSIQGRVSTAKGAPIVGARIVLGRLVEDRRARDGKSFSPYAGGAPAATSGPDGGYEVRGLPAGVELMLQAEHEEFQTERSAALKLAADETRTDVDFRLQRAASIEVELVAPDGKSPRSRVTAHRIADEKGKPGGRIQRSATLDGRGHARLQGLSGGTWRVVVERWYESLQGRPTREVKVEVGGTARVVFDVP